MGESNEKEIEIRTLTGDSITLQIPSTATFQHLKLLLNQSFPPATNSPNFHLFFKGDKLRLQTQIGSYPIQLGEFLVLVPFSKKKQSTRSNQPDPSDASATSSNISTSKLSDSTWSNIMQDLSHLRDTATDGAALNDDSNASTTCSQTKRGFFGSESDRQRELPYHLILNTLQCNTSSEGGGALGEQDCEVFSKVLESVNCLSDLPRGGCKLFKSARLKGVGPRANNGCNSTCLCPPWLKIVMKAFAFLNIFSAFLHLHCRKTTSNLLEEALDQLGKFGVKLCLQDMKNLSLLCSRLICFGNDIEKTSSNDVIVVINRSTSDKDQIEDNPKRARKWLCVSKIVSTLKRRDRSFRNSLWWAFEQLPCIFGDEMAVVISLEELLGAIKDHESVGKESQTKRIKRSSTTSKPDLDRIGCHDTKPLPAVDMVEHLKKGIGSEGQIVHIEDICARKAINTEIPIELSQKVRSALKCIGVSKLYSHQAESIQASLNGKNVVVATMTSSGKSLCYNVPVVEVLSRNPSSCALYIFPTKALAQDQRRALLNMTKGFDVNFNIGIYDGDTSQHERTWLRDNSRLLITNPDMLHISILPHHQLFHRILSNLRFVVIDETHTYKGAFGSHTALILRRLRRLCSHVYGTVPSFVFSTATSANPCEHSMELANLPTLELVQNDGSPSARKLFILWNPILRPKTFLKKGQFAIGTDELAGESANFVRSSPIVDISRLFAEMVQHGLRCITFYVGFFMRQPRI